MFSTEDVVLRVVLNKEISVGNKNRYVDTNMVRFEMYTCGSKRPIRWGKIGKLGHLVVKPNEGPFPEENARIDRFSTCC
jgi:predicted DNA-binding WGR domain protein